MYTPSIHAKVGGHVFMASTDDFFEESTEQSEIKSRIVADYFSAWAKVIRRTASMRVGRIAYLDLFAGPGRYKNGRDSTPIVVLKKAIADPALSQMLVTSFNDKTKQHAIDLKHTIETLPGIEKLKYAPRVENREVDSKFVDTLESIRLVPSFLFVDPWGYKGLSLALIRSVLKDWGCDCVFFFNYNRVNMGLANEMVREHMDVLFSEGRADSLRKRLEGSQPADREKLVLEELSDALKELGARYVRPFSFRNADDTRTTHHLIFASKVFKGYEIMKDIMGRESSVSFQGVPSFFYSAAYKTKELLPGLFRPLDDLEKMLVTDFAGERLTMRQIFERHSVDRDYVGSNYKKALISLEGKGEIQAVPPADKRPKNKGLMTFADHVIAVFPKGSRK